MTVPEPQSETPPRPGWLARHIHGVTGLVGLALLCLFAWLAGRLSMDRTTNAFGSAFGDFGDAASNQHGWLAVAVLVAAVAVGILYYFQERSEYDAAERVDTDAGQAGISTPDIQRMQETFAQEMSGPQALILVKGIVAPHLVKTRCTERLVPRTRALKRTTIHEFAIPRGRKQPKDAYVPLMRFHKGYLQDLREFRTVEGAMVSTLTFAESVALALEALKVTFAASIPDGDERLRAQVGYLEVEDQIREVIGWRARRSNTPDLVKAINALAKAHGASVDIVQWVTLAIELLAQEYVIVVKAPVQMDRVVIEVSDHIVPTRLSRGLSQSPARRLLLTVVNTVQAAIGARPARYLIVCSLASTAQSYHLEFEGPEGTYLARQHLTGTTRKELRATGAYDRWRGRHGQRYAHLYMRSAWRSGSPVKVQLHFLERPPGTLGPAAIASAAVAALLFVAFYTPKDDPGRALSVAAALVTLPTAAAAWAGYNTPNTSVGHGAVARVSLIASLALATVGLICIVLQEDDFSAACWLAVANAMVTGYWWLVRGNQYGALVGEEGELSKHRNPTETPLNPAQ